MRRSDGFTLVELITTLLLIGVLAMVVAPRLSSLSVFEARGFHDETLALLRYAQKSAVAQRRQVCVAFSATGATVSIASVSGSSTCDTDLSSPSGPPPFQVLAPTGIAYSTYPASISFDALGRVGTQQSIQVSGVSETITVEAETGYVHP